MNVKDYAIEKLQEHKEKFFEQNPGATTVQLKYDCMGAALTVALKMIQQLLDIVDIENMDITEERKDLLSSMRILAGFIKAYDSDYDTLIFKIDGETLLDNWVKELVDES